MEQETQWDSLDTLTDEAATLIRQGHMDDPRIAQAVHMWAKRAEAAARTSSWGERLDQEDTLAEASLWVLEQLIDYRESDEVGEGTASGFLGARLNWFASQTRRKDSLLITKADFKVAGILSGLRENYYAQGRSPGLDEIRADIHREALRQYIDNVTLSNPDLPEQEVKQAAIKRLSKDGVEKSLDILPQLLSVSGAPVSLDQPASDEGQGTLADVLITREGVTSELVTNAEVDSLRLEERTDRLAELALGQHQWARTALAVRGGSESEGVVDEATLDALAASTGHDVNDLREVIRLSRARVHAPHAQWAHLTDAALL